jgi:hypothetical protein
MVTREPERWMRKRSPANDLHAAELYEMSLDPLLTDPFPFAEGAAAFLFAILFPVLTPRALLLDVRLDLVLICELTHPRHVQPANDQRFGIPMLNHSLPVDLTQRLGLQGLGLISLTGLLVNAEQVQRRERYLALTIGGLGQRRRSDASSHRPPPYQR